MTPPPDLELDTAAVRERLAANLAAVDARITAAADAAGRPAPELVAVTKTVVAGVARLLARELGRRDLAENRADPFRDKADALAGMDPAPRWHFVGHLQRNKARRVLERCDVLHSVDSARLARTVARLTGELDREVSAYAQVNLTGEDEKYGMAAGSDELREALEALQGAPGVRLLGLMAMGPLDSRPGARTTDEVFRDVQALASDLDPALFHGGRCLLSMGMSGDLEAAVRHGSTSLRVGSALFEGLDDACFRGGGA